MLPALQGLDCDETESDDAANKRGQNPETKSAEPEFKNTLAKNLNLNLSKKCNLTLSHNKERGK